MSATRMDPRVRALWVAALRSGKYIQGRQQLRIPLQLGAPGIPQKHCCLGVLEELHSAETGLPFPSNRATLSPVTMCWAGLKDSNPTTTKGCMIAMNDGTPVQGGGPLTFSEIADVIEAEL